MTIAVDWNVKHQFKHPPELVKVNSVSVRSPCGIVQ